MRYLTFDTEQDALDVSAAEAKARGCGPTTTHWYAIAEAVDGDFVMIIYDSKKFKDSTDKKPKLKEDKDSPDTGRSPATL